MQHPAPDEGHPATVEAMIDHVSCIAGRVAVAVLPLLALAAGAPGRGAVDGGGAA